MGMGIFGGILMFVLFVLAAVLGSGSGEPSAANSILGCSMMCTWLLWAVSVALGITGLVKKETAWPGIVGVVVSGGGILGTVLLVIIGLSMK